MKTERRRHARRQDDRTLLELIERAEALQEKFDTDYSQLLAAFLKSQEDVAYWMRRARVAELRTAVVDVEEIRA